MNRVLSMYSRVLGLSSEKRLVSWLKHLNFLSPRFLLPSIKTTNKYINISLPEKFNPYFYRWSRHEKVITSNFQFQREQAIPLLFVIIFKVLGYQLAKQPESGFCTAYFTFCLHHWSQSKFLWPSTSSITWYFTINEISDLLRNNPNYQSFFLLPHGVPLKATSFILYKHGHELLFVISLLAQLLQVVTYL